MSFSGSFCIGMSFLFRAHFVLDDATDGLFRESALEYILSSSDFEMDIFNDVFSQYIDIEQLMTIEKQLKQEGRLEERQEIIKNLLTAGLDPEFVSKNTGVELVVVKKIKATMH